MMQNLEESHIHKKGATRKKNKSAKLFCSCDDLRAENAILINQPELLPGQMESRAHRKHVAERLGKEKLAEEGRNPWDRADDSRNMDVFYCQATEACYKEATSRAFWIWYQTARQEKEQAQSSKEKHKSGQKWLLPTS